MNKIRCDWNFSDANTINLCKKKDAYFLRLKILSKSVNCVTIIMVIIVYDLKGKEISVITEEKKETNDIIDFDDTLDLTEVLEELKEDDE